MDQINVLLCLSIILAYFTTIVVCRQAIIGGIKASKHQFPYQVSLVFYGHGHDCGGGIITNQHVLTAGHCVVTSDGRIDDTRMKILAGTNDLRRIDKSAVSVEIKKIYVPREYDQSNIYTTADIAVLKLKHSLDFHKHKHLKSLELPIDNSETYIGKRAIIAGFGWNWMNADYNKLVQYGGGANDTLLRYIDTLVLSPNDKHYPTPHRSHKKHLCAKTDQTFEASGACYGDSGGPLVYENRTVIGILSVTPWGCIDKYKAATYTRVSAYLDFIYNAVHDIPNDDDTITFARHD